MATLAFMRTTHLACTATLVLLSSIALGQCADAWAVFSEGDPGQGAAELVFDGAGDLFQIGGCAGQCTFGGITVNAAPITLFVTKYNAQGEVLWVRLATGTSSLASRCAATDADGNLYIAGSHRGEATFGAFTLPAVQLGASIGFGGFVAKYSAAGVLQWARPWQGTGNLEFNGLAMDTVANELIVGGAFTDETDFAGTADGLDLLLLRMTPDGDLVHTTTFTRPGAQNMHDIALGADGEVYIAGSFEGDAITVPNGELVSAGASDALLLRVDGDTITWGQRAGGGSSDTFWRVRMGAPGRVCVPMNLNDEADFAGTPITSGGGWDVGMAVLDATTGALMWNWHSGGPLQDASNAVCYDAVHGVYHVSGTFFGNIPIGDLEVVGTAPQGNSVLLTFQEDGELIDTDLLNDQACCVVEDVETDATGRTFVVGTITGSAGTVAGWPVAPTSFHAFALQWCDAMLNVQDAVSRGLPTLFPVPAAPGTPVRFTWPTDVRDLEVIVLDMSGRVVQDQRTHGATIAVTTDRFHAGAYLVKAYSQNRYLGCARMLVE